MNSETEKEANKTEKNRYLCGTYRGAVFNVDTDQDCWVQMLEASLHGNDIFHSGWVDITDNLDSEYAAAERMIDRILENESTVYANKHDFRCDFSCYHNSVATRYDFSEKSKLGCFVIDDIIVYAAFLAVDGKNFIYGEISEEEFELLRNSYRSCISREMIKMVNQEVIKKARLFYLMQDGPEERRTKITKKDLYSLNAKFYQYKDTGVIFYVMNDKFFEWHDHDSKWVSFSSSLINSIKDNPNIVPVCWEDAWKRINEFNSFSKNFEAKRTEEEKKAREAEIKKEAETEKSTKQEPSSNVSSKSKEILKSNTADKNEYKKTSSNQTNMKIRGLGNHANGLFKAAVIMNYAVAAINLLIAVILLFTGNFLDAAGLAGVAVIYTGLTILFQKTKSDISAFLMLLCLAIIDMGGVIGLTATGIALFMVIGLSYNMVLGFPARLFAFIIARHYNSKTLATLLEMEEKKNWRT